MSITAGDEPIRQILDLRAGVLSLTSVLTAGGKPLPSGVRYHVYEAAKDADGNRKLVTQSSELYGPPRFPLPAGRYYVIATYGSASAGAEVSITAGDEPIRQIWTFARACSASRVSWPLGASRFRAECGTTSTRPRKTRTATGNLLLRARSFTDPRDSRCRRAATTSPQALMPGKAILKSRLPLERRAKCNCDSAARTTVIRQHESPPTCVARGPTIAPKRRNNQSLALTYPNGAEGIESDAGYL